jgi:hypothetical protein
MFDAGNRRLSKDVIRFLKKESVNFKKKSVSAELIKDSHRHDMYINADSLGSLISADRSSEPKGPADQDEARLSAFVAGLCIW